MPRTRPTESTPAYAERIRELLTLAYEGAQAAADEGLIDFSVIGEPLAEALALLHGDEAAA